MSFVPIKYEYDDKKGGENNEKEEDDDGESCAFVNRQQSVVKRNFRVEELPETKHENNNFFLSFLNVVVASYIQL